MKKLVAVLAASLITTSAMAFVSGKERAVYYFGGSYSILAEFHSENYFEIGEMVWSKMVDRPWEGCDWSHTATQAEQNGWWYVYLNNEDVAEKSFLGELILVVHDENHKRATLIACLPDDSGLGTFENSPEAYQQLYAARAFLKEDKNKKLFVSEWTFKWTPYGVDASSLWTIPEDAQE